MELILALLVAFVLACVAWPNFVKSRPRFILGVAAVALAMLCFALGQLFLSRVFIFLAHLLEIVALLMMVTSGAGGRLRQWYEDVRSGIREL